MTGKEFFGKLLSNRQERRSPWSEEEPTRHVPEADVDVMPSDGGGSHDRPVYRDNASREEAPSNEAPSTDRSAARTDPYFDAPLSRLEAPSTGRESWNAADPRHERDGGYALRDARPRDSQPPRDEPTLTTTFDPSEAPHARRLVDDERPFDDSRTPGGDGISADLPHVQPRPRDIEESRPAHAERSKPAGSEAVVRGGAPADAPRRPISTPERSGSEHHAGSGAHVHEPFDGRHAGAPVRHADAHGPDAGIADAHGRDAGAHERDADAHGPDAVQGREPGAEGPDVGAHGRDAGVNPPDAGAHGRDAGFGAREGSIVPPAPEGGATHAPDRAAAPAYDSPDQRSQPPEAAAEKTAVERERPAGKQPAKRDSELRNIKDRVVLRLLDKKVVTVEQVKAALTNRDKKNLKATLWRILAQQGGTDREQIYREAALTYAFTERTIDEGKIDLDFIRQVADVFPEKKRNRLIELRIVPIGYEFEQQTQLLRVVFITHDPSLPAVRELMQDLNLERYELQYASETTVKDLLSRAFPKKNEYLERMTDDPLAYDLGTSYDEEKSELIDEDALEAEINRSSLINLFEGALVEAVHRGASDIHIYPNAHRQIEFHFRVDGRLAHWHTEDKVHPESLLAVIKDNTMNVDRFERDMAQDGFIQRKVDDALIRYRVSILPIATASSNIHAESIVIRVLDDRKVITDLSKLGLLSGALERFDMAIRQPHGMVILTGPTGSGKSTTLVAALHQVVTPQVNVLTVEDPVEYIISGVRQIKLNHKLGLEGALRAILRHDPDVVMVGEMRDKATADLAVKLANTGHLTFSTLHTNDAPSAVSRLYKMGVEPFLIAYAINLVVAQRLLRNLCPDCKIVDDDPDPVLLKKLGFTEQDIQEHTIYRASGDPTCKRCKGVGYKGRRAISEALYFSREIRHMIVEADKKIDEDALRVTARSQGMLTLQDSAREVVKMGETSVDEMMRVTMTED